MITGSVVQSWVSEAGRLLRVRLASPPGNVIDGRMLEGLSRALAEPAPGVVAMLLDAEGPDFSFGSSVAEHAPGPIQQALPQFHDLFRRLVAFPVPVAAVIRGRCLGGGLELACGCDALFSSREATFAQPEVKLGVFAPVGSLALRERVGDGAARDLLLSGRPIGAPEALRLGLVQSVADEPEVAALAWLRDHVLESSPSSLRFAVRAARLRFAAAVLPVLAEIEALYLRELMATPDPAEGVQAFLEKRPPRWQDPGVPPATGPRVPT